MENLIESKSVPEQPKNSMGKMLIAVTAGVAVGVSIVCYSFVSPAFRRFTLPYIPATDSQLKNIFSVLPKKPLANQRRLLDIGSGDGRIVITAAKVP
jgi:methylase of polypeptide subunit release factors